MPLMTYTTATSRNVPTVSAMSLHHDWKSLHISESHPPISVAILPVILFIVFHILFHDSSTVSLSVSHAPEKSPVINSDKPVIMPVMIIMALHIAKVIMSKPIHTAEDRISHTIINLPKVLSRNQPITSPITIIAILIIPSI